MLYLQSRGLEFRYPIEVSALFQFLALHHLYMSSFSSIPKHHIPTSPSMNARGYKVEPWEDPSPLLSISRDTSIATSISRPQRLRTYRDGLAWLVCWTCSSGSCPQRMLERACLQVVVRKAVSNEMREALREACSDPLLNGTRCKYYISVQVFGVSQRQAVMAVTVSTSHRQGKNGWVVSSCFFLYYMVLVRCTPRWADDQKSTFITVEIIHSLLLVLPILLKLEAPRNLLLKQLT